MKILHIINDLEPAGAQRLLLDMVQLSLKDSVNRQDILIIRDSKRHPFYSQIKQLPVTLIEGDFKSLFNPLILFFLYKKIRGYDIVHSHLFPDQYWTALAGRLFIRESKMLTTEHNTHNRRRENAWFRPLEQWMYNSYDRVISISNETQDKLLAWLGKNEVERNPEKYPVIENGVDLERFKTAVPLTRDALGLKSDSVLLLMVARMEDQKDHVTLFKALQLLPEDFELLLVGEGSKENEYKAYCKSKGIAERVKFLGPRPDVPSIIKTADICILSSNWEGFGLVAVEYMAAGKPVVASNVAGLNKVVEDAGLLFERGDHEQLKESILRLSSDLEFYNLVSERCRQRAKSYSMFRMYEAYLNVYESLLNAEKVASG